MGFFQRLFGSRPSPSPDLPPRDRDEFYRLICREGPWILTKGIKENGEAELIDCVDDGGRHVWPVFSTQTTAAMWVRESGVTVVTAFQCLQLTVEGFVNSIPAGARVVFDARTPHERVMTDEDLAFLRTLLSEKNRIGRPG